MLEKTKRMAAERGGGSPTLGTSFMKVGGFWDSLRAGVSKLSRDDREQSHFGRWWNAFQTDFPPAEAAGATMEAEEPLSVLDKSLYPLSLHERRLQRARTWEINRELAKLRHTGIGRRGRAAEIAQQEIARLKESGALLGRDDRRRIRAASLADLTTQEEAAAAEQRGELTDERFRLGVSGLRSDVMRPMSYEARQRFARTEFGQSGEVGGKAVDTMAKDVRELVKMAGDVVKALNGVVAELVGAKQKLAVAGKGRG